MALLEVTKEGFLYDKQQFRILSGSIHYFRVVPEYWEDRLIKLKACGFNTVETYIPWSLHEPRPGEFYFEGMADVERYIETAHKLGLFVIVRPSPYICAEMDLGGLPPWLMAEPDMKFRCYYKPYLERIDKYYDVLLPKLRPFLCTNGGPIIAVQIENEYGSYGNDKEYLEYLKDGLISRGIDALLFTSDGPTHSMLQGGTLPGVLKTVNFGSHPEEAFQILKEYQSDKPLFCAEFWNGWFDHWGGKHCARDSVDVAAVMDKMLEMGASINFYMFHGGTNFGFLNGANHDGIYKPTVTSYDYDAPLDESGEPTLKYYAIKEVIRKYFKPDSISMPEPAKKKNFGCVYFNEQVELFEALEVLAQRSESKFPVPMEKLGQNHGLILYETYVTGPRPESELALDGVHDRAQVFLDGNYVGLFERWLPEKKLRIEIPESGAKLSILVENMGHINYGPQMKDMKGIIGGVRIENQFLFNWTIYNLPLSDIGSLKYGCIKATDKPVFYRGTLVVDQIGDTFIDMQGWSRGIVWVNGFNLGRYWEVGPQRTLYIPGPVLNEGKNEVIVLELHCAKEPSVMFTDSMILDS